MTETERIDELKELQAKVKRLEYYQFLTAVTTIILGLAIILGALR